MTTWHPSHDVTDPDPDDKFPVWWCKVCARPCRTWYFEITVAGRAPCDTPALDLVEKDWGMFA